MRSLSRKRAGLMFGMAGLIAWSVAVAAGTDSTTLILNQPAAQVFYATISPGSRDDAGAPAALVTRGADANRAEQRAFIKFDTEHTIPLGANVASALMTLTLKRAGADGSRRIAAYQVTTAWNETEVTWSQRRAGYAWTTAGGDLGSKLAEQAVGNEPGSKLIVDVTPLVQQAALGQLGPSRYTRVALIDVDAGATDSTREFFTPDETDASLRPMLTVTYAGSNPVTTSDMSSSPATPSSSDVPSSSADMRPSSTPQPAPASSARTLRVLHWNTHHGGVGTDGVLDADRLIKKAASFDPDLVSLNEVERFTGWGDYDGPAVIAALMEKYTGTPWYSAFTTATGNDKGNGNLILSRVPFDAKEVRLFSHDRAAIDVAVTVNGRTINFVSTHLDNESAANRLEQAGELTSWAAGLAEPRILAGDFNDGPGSDVTRVMTRGYLDSWNAAADAGTAVSFAGNRDGLTRQSRIDYIFLSKSAGVLTLKSSQVFDVADANGVMPSDHRPVLSVFTVK